MKKNIKFSRKSDVDFWVEYLDFREDFLKINPDILKNPIDKNGRLIDLAISICFYPNKKTEAKPLWLFRHMNPDSTRWVGIIEPGDEPLEYQKGGIEGLADERVPIHPYKKLSDNPVCYGIGSDKPKFEYRYYLDHVTINENDMLIGSAEYFPVTMIQHQSVWNEVSPIFINGIIKGIFKGEPIIGIARINRAYMPETINRSFNYHGYIDNSFVGIREDGRKEMASMHYDASGKIFASYWLEGEEIVSTDEFEMETEWIRLPYCEDGTCIYKDATFRFCDKEIHFVGKWGSKGFTSYPRIKDKPGQSHIFGTWYEGKTPYKHTVYSTLVENQEAFDYKIKELGFDVVNK